MALIDLKSDLTWTGQFSAGNYSNTSQAPGYDGAQNPSGPNASNADQSGFTTNRRKWDPTEFTGVTGQVPDQQFNRPNVPTTIIGATNVFPNTHATGFTLSRKHMDDTEFKEVTDQYIKFQAVGPEGFPFKQATSYPSVGDKILTNPDWTQTYKNVKVHSVPGNENILQGYPIGINKYSDALKRATLDGTGAPLGFVGKTYITNSPIDEIYNKYKVRDEAYNATGYFRQPLILRGIQRDNNSSPQRWGIANFDDGLMRGGIVSATERSLIDTVRIGKFLAKPQGLSFLIKQFGLQLSNPNVETIGGRASKPFAQMTKIFTPINLLANTAGSAFGLHFKRHGILPIGGTMSYTDNVVKNRPHKTRMNRLVRLQGELLTGKIKPKGLAATGLGQKIKAIQQKLGFEGQEIKTLSGITGPGSIYGIGATTMRRASSTIPDDTREIQGLGQWGDYTLFKQYSGGKDGFWYLKKEDGSVFTMNTEDGQKDWYKHLGISRATQLDENYEPTEILGDNFPDDTLATNISDNRADTIQKYSALAYGSLKKERDTQQYHDFRKDLNAPFIGKDADYKDDNLNTAYKIGNPGDPGKDRSNWKDNTATGRGNSGVDGVNNLPFNASPQQEKDNPDLIRFKIETVNAQPIIFRSFLTSLTDSFNPSVTQQRLFGFSQANDMFNMIARQISITLVVAAQSREEMKNLWNKLDKLAQMCLPMRNGGVNYLQPAYLTVGNMYSRQSGYLASLTYDWDTETPWDVDYKVPMYTTVDLMFEVKTYEDELFADFTRYKAFNGLKKIEF